jgi:hypothetical protein
MAPLVLEMVRGSEARNERSVTATVRLRNVTDQRVAVYLRRDLITFEVEGPDGNKTTCEPIDAMRHPARRGFTIVAAHRSVVLTARLVELCPRWTFARRGEYLLRARYDPRVTGKTVGVEAFTGELDAGNPVSVRVRHDTRVVVNHFVSRNSPQQAPPKAAVPVLPPARSAQRPAPARR